MIEFSGVLVAISALSLTVTKIVDFFRNLLDKDVTWPKWVWNVAALVIGFAFALGWEINIAGAIVALVPALAESAEHFNGLSGEILTGFVIGMTAGFWHELLSALSSIQTKNEAIAAGAPLE